MFIHCWDEKYEKEIVKLYKPKKSKFEKQIVFDENDIRRHFIESRWYGAKQVNELKKEYELGRGGRLQRGWEAPEGPPKNSEGF